MSKYFTSPVGRIRFINITKPSETTGKFDVTLLLPKEDAKVKDFVKDLWTSVKQEAETAAQKSQDKTTNSADALLRRSTFLRDGDNKASFEYIDRDSGEKKNSWRAEYAGNYVLRAKKKPDPARPQDKIGAVKYQKGAEYNSVVVDPSEIYPGCHGCVRVNLYSTTKPHMGKLYLCLSIMHVMKVYDDTPFTSGGGGLDDAFGDVDIPEAAIPQELGGAVPTVAAQAASVKANIPTTYDPFSVV